jgi:DsbC/DsbD-like thiol-disulfide interchange protein
VQWPAPQRFTDSEGSTIGYKSNVVFPLRIERRDNSRPVTLRVKLDYAICERLCIPVEAKAELPLGSATPASEPQVAAAEAAIPKPQALRTAAPLSIWNIIADLDAKPARVLVEVKAPADTPLTLFAEGPSPDWALPLPEPTGGGSDQGIKRFAVVLDGLPPGATAKGATLTLTAVSGGQAIETPVRLD